MAMVGVENRVVVVEGFFLEEIEKLHGYMDQLGKVEQVSSYEGLLFVLFESVESPARAIKDLHGREFEGTVLTIRYPSLSEMKLLDSMFGPVGSDPIITQIATLIGKLKPDQKAQLQGLLSESPNQPLSPPAMQPQPSHIYVPTGLPHIPRLPIFSGEDNKEVTFERWHYEVKCLLSTGTPHSLVLQAIRQSLRKTPADVLTWMGEGASVMSILEKLEGLYGNVLTGEALIKQFYTEAQRPDETVASWGCRLEQILTQAATRGQVDKTAMDSMLRKKFWGELYNEKIKMAVRHRLDSVKSFSQLVAEVRQIELEFKEDRLKVYKGKKTGTVSQVTQKEDPTLLEMIKNLTAQVNRLEAKVENEQQPCTYQDMGSIKKNQMDQKTRQRKQTWNNQQSRNPSQKDSKHFKKNQTRISKTANDIICYRCGQVGHLSYGCRVDLDSQEKNSNYQPNK